ncbi:MAG TPA: hypothetical protein VI756_09765, partial [Blastocatellia bacterium]
DIMATVGRSQPGFAPAGNAAPNHYRLLFRMFGFRFTETTADIWRRVSGRRAGKSSSATSSEPAYQTGGRPISA